MPYDDTPAQGIHIDVKMQALIYGGKVCRLQAGPFLFCKFLMQTPSIVKTREEILEMLGKSEELFDRTVDSYAKRARKLLIKEFGFSPIRTVYRVGYTWDDVTALKKVDYKVLPEIWCDHERVMVRRGMESCVLTLTEYKICESLSRRPGVIKTRDLLVDTIYDGYYSGDRRLIDSHVQRARRKLRKAFGVSPIKTSYKFGYYWYDVVPPQSDLVENEYTLCAAHLNAKVIIQAVRQLVGTASTRKCNEEYDDEA
jgi:DNA-binding response OmpR family regulator